MARRLALALVLAIFVGLMPRERAFAASDGQRAFLTLTVNGAPGGDVLVILRADDVLVHARELQDLGLRVPDGAVTLVTGDPFVSTRALGEKSSAKVDSQALTLAITVPPAMFRAQRISDGRDSTRITQAPIAGGGFVNYALTTSNGGAPTANAQLDTRLGRGLFEVAFAPTLDRRGYAVQSPSYTIDDFGGARRTVLGTSAISVDDFAGLGGAVYLDGFTTRRELRLNPNFIHQSTSAVSGVAAAPSTVDVYVNGTLVRHESIAPGPFELTNVPLQGGANQTTVVVRDTFGNAQTIGRPEYIAADLLPRGQAEYAFGIGRLHLGAPGAVVAGRYETGLREGLTLGARAYVTPSIRNAGMFGAFATVLGEFSIAASLSAAQAVASTALLPIDIAAVVPQTVSQLPFIGTAPGQAYAFAWTRATNRSDVGISLVGESPHYASAALDAGSDRAITQLRAFAHLQLGSDMNRSQFGFEALASSFRDAPRDRSYAVTYTRMLTRRLSATASFGAHTLGAVTRPAATFRLDADLLGAAHVSAGSVNQDGQTARTIEVGRLATGALGTSYSAAVTNGTLPQTTLMLQQRDRLGTLQLFSSSNLSQRTTQATLSGAVAYAGGHPYLSRTISDGFGVLDLDGVSGVAVKVNNDLEGHTDRHGRLFFPNLSSTSANEVTLDGEDLPPGVVIDTDRALITPGYRAGTPVKIGARHVHAYVGSLRLAGTDDGVPAYGLATIATAHGDVSSDIGSDGRFYFDALDPGTYAIRVRYAGGSCSVREIVVRSTSATLTNLGTLTCGQETQ